MDHTRILPNPDLPSRKKSSRPRAEKISSEKKKKKKKKNQYSFKRKKQFFENRKD